MPELSNRTLILMTLAAWAFQAFYLVMPLDLIPDLLPFLGLIDDLVGLSGTLGLTLWTARTLHERGFFRRLIEGEEPAVYEPVDEVELRAW